LKFSKKKNKLMKKFLLFITSIFFLSFNSFSQCTNCDVGVTVRDLDLRNAIDTIWQIEGLDRNGKCCGASGNSTTCVKFNLLLNEQTEQLKFEMHNPAPNGAAARYWIDCATPQYGLGDDVCISGRTSMCLVYCKNGHDPNALYTISVGRNTKASSDISLVAGCIDTISVQGMSAGTISWTAVAATPALVTQYNGYLSSTTASLVYVQAPTPLPSGVDYVDYVVTGQAAGCSSGTARDTVRVNFIANSLSVQITPDNPAICHDGTGVVITAVGSGGTPPYSYLWSKGAATTDNITVLTSDIVGG
jgi:hypothetical protein